MSLLHCSSGARLSQFLLFGECIRPFCASMLQFCFSPSVHLAYAMQECCREKDCSRKSWSSVAGNGWDHWQGVSGSWQQFCTVSYWEHLTLNGLLSVTAWYLRQILQPLPAECLCAEQSQTSLWQTVWQRWVCTAYPILVLYIKMYCI